MTGPEEEDAKRLEEEARRLEQEAARLENQAHQEERLAHELEDQAHELEERARHGQHGVKITMVVNGTPTEIHAKEDELLAEVRLKALEKTHNLAQPPENWEIKNEAGEMLDPEKPVRHYHFGKEVTLFLSLKAGVAG